MNNHRLCCRRDKAILEAIERHQVLNTDQIHLLHFSSLNDGLRIAQKRLKKLTDNKKLKRARESFDQPFYYYMGKKPGQPYHQLGVNWVYVWFNLRFKGWELTHFSCEVDYGILRADAFAVLRNITTGKHSFSFVEFDNAESGNDFDKVIKYNSLYSSGKYMSAWWVPYANRFPAVLVITTNRARFKAIEKRVKQENVNGLEFQVYILDQIKGACQNENNRILLPAAASK